MAASLKAFANRSVFAYAFFVPVKALFFVFLLAYQVLLGAQLLARFFLRHGEYIPHYIPQVQLK